ncbi:MAG: TetR/AcrR family transcriptional regulator [Acidimicrobiales bacterium]
MPRAPKSGDRHDGAGGTPPSEPTSDIEPTSDSAGRRARKKAVTRSQILDAATRLFWEHGYESTSIQDIADAADVAFRTFYLHFATKAEVAIARFEEWLGDMVASLADRPPGERPDEMLAGALESLTAKGYAGDLLTPEGMPVSPVPFAVILAEDSPEVAGRLFQAMTRSHQKMTEMFRERLDYPAGSFEPRIVAASFFATFISTVYGYSEVSTQTARPPSSNTFALQAISAYVNGVGQIVDSSPAATRR